MSLICLAGVLRDVELHVRSDLHWRLFYQNLLIDGASSSSPNERKISDSSCTNISQIMRPALLQLLISG